MKRCLVLYASKNGATDKVARELARLFTERGWRADLKRIEPLYNFGSPDFDLRDYDFLCAGSWTCWGLPAQQMQELFRALIQLMDIPPRKIIPGPKCALAFATYGGAHLGPAEAKANLALLELLYEHLGFYSLGTIAAPGAVVGADIAGSPDDPNAHQAWHHPDIAQRPDESDMRRLAEFVDQIFDHPMMAHGLCKE